MTVNALIRGRMTPCRIIAGTFALALLPFLLVKMYPTRLYGVMNAPSYLVFHNFAELFSVIVSLSIFGVGWFTYEWSKDRHALFLSAAFFAIGLMDLMHTLGYSGMPAFLTPNSANKSTQFWIAVRFYAAAAFLASAFIRPDRPRFWLTKSVLMTQALIVAALVFIGVTFFSSHLPATFVDGVGLTAFKKIAEYVIIFLLLLAISAYWKRSVRSPDRGSFFYLSALLFCIISELVFAVYKSVFDVYNVLGHVYKIIAFSLIYKALFTAAVGKPYCKLSDANEELRSEITGHQHAEERLRTAVAYNRGLIEASLDPLVTIGPDGKITDVNAATELATGRSRKELIGTDFSAYFTEPEKARMGYEQVFREGMVRDYALELRRSEGWITPVLYNAVVYRDGTGNVIGVFAAARDITELRRAERTVNRLNKQLEQRVKDRTAELVLTNKELETAKIQAETANKSKSDFLSSMSHELRTPLNSVIGFSEVLHDQLFGALNDKQLEYVDNIYGSGKHLLSIINDILDLSKVESGKMELEPAAFTLRSLIESSLTMVKERAMRHNITLSIDLSPEADCSLIADERKLKQVLFNLLSNAVKFTPDGGSVSVNARKVRSGEKTLLVNVSQRDIYDGIEVSVVDTGIGIRFEDREKLFKPFSQLESPYTRNHEGTGLGLALTKKLVELHNGAVSVKSEIGKGSTFTVVLPIRQRSATA